MRELEIVERIVRNMPIVKPRFMEFDSDLGKIYIGMGTDAKGTYHGAWAVLRGPGFCRTLHFDPDQSEQACINTLKQDALGAMELLNDHDLLLPGAFGG